MRSRPKWQTHRVLPQPYSDCTGRQADALHPQELRAGQSALSTRDPVPRTGGSREGRLSARCARSDIRSWSRKAVATPTEQVQLPLHLSLHLVKGEKPTMSELLYTSTSGAFAKRASLRLRAPEYSSIRRSPSATFTMSEEPFTVPSTSTKGVKSAGSKSSSGFMLPRYHHIKSRPPEGCKSHAPRMKGSIHREASTPLGGRASGERSYRRGTCKGVGEVGRCCHRGERGRPRGCARALHLHTRRLSPARTENGTAGSGPAPGRCFLLWPPNEGQAFRCSHTFCPSTTVNALISNRLHHVRKLHRIESAKRRGAYHFTRGD